MVKTSLFFSSAALVGLLSVVAAPAHASEDHEHDPLFYKVSVDRLEWFNSKGNSGLRWEGSASYGGDSDKALLTSRGTRAENGTFENAEVQALWSHMVSDYFDVHAGVRGETSPTPERASLVLGIEGLAPYWIETKAHMFVGTHGAVSLRLEAETDLALTTKLILQPSLELNATSQDDRQRNLYSGLTNLEGGLRLRYEVTPNIAPYVGVSWERALGESNLQKDIDRHDDEITSVVSGIRLMF